MGFTIQNARVLNDHFAFAPLDVAVENDTIAALLPQGSVQEQPAIDAEGMLLIPGLIDIHNHGNSGCDYCDGDTQAVKKMADFLARNGVTSFLATTMSLPEETLTPIFSSLGDYYKNQTGASRMLGVYMEGPYLCKAKKGAHVEDNIIPPDYEMLRRLDKAGGFITRVVAVAPETDGQDAFLKQARGQYVLSVAHTNASYAQAAHALANGYTNATHLYNAMPAPSHRDPSVLGALFESNATVELISDGIHVHPVVVRETFTLFGCDRVVFVSDAMRAAGMPDGIYDLGGQTVQVKNFKATLENGTIAGSAVNLMECVRRAVGFGIPLEHAVKAASYNPARAIGRQEQVGSIKVGKLADLVLLDEHLNVRRVFVGGREISL